MFKNAHNYEVDDVTLNFDDLPLPTETLSAALLYKSEPWVLPPPQNDNEWKDARHFTGLTGLYNVAVEYTGARPDFLAFLRQRDSITHYEEMKSDFVAFLNQHEPGFEHGRGNIGKWTYDDTGAELWNLFEINHDAYYVLKNQIALIQKHAKWLHSLVGDVDLLVDFGCGGSEAILNQIFPLIDEFSIAADGSKKELAYAPIDTSEAFIKGATKQVLDRYPDMAVYPRWKNFLQEVVLPDGKKLGFFFGASTNFPKFPDGMNEILDAFRKTLGPGSYLVMIFDTNRDPVSIRQSYNHPLHAKQMTNVIHIFSEDLGIAGIHNSDAWQYETDIDPFECQGYPVVEVDHVLKSLEPQYIVLESHASYIEEGERFIADKSYKFPVELLSLLAMERKYQLMGCQYDDEEWMAMPVFHLN